jgi:protein-ribulosamine 3-kinase
LQQAVESNLVLSEILEGLGRGEPVQVSAVSGGCIAQAKIVTFADHSQVFIKTAEGSPDMFKCEAKGLETLAAADAIRVPVVLAVAEGGLVLEAIQCSRASADFFEIFGRGFARLHEREGSFFGFESDNFIGSTEQLNGPVGNGESWPDFFLERRLRYQPELAGLNGHGHELLGLLDSAEINIKTLIGASNESPRLLHGDLWGGNFIVDEQGMPCLIDPAVYYGHRETDLAMTRLFGGFDRGFYDAYQEASPLDDGHDERLPIYQLYHLLNHLNLFGRAYYAQCRQILMHYV